MPPKEGATAVKMTTTERVFARDLRGDGVDYTSNKVRGGHGQCSILVTQSTVGARNSHAQGASRMV